MNKTLFFAVYAEGWRELKGWPPYKPEPPVINTTKSDLSPRPDCVGIRHHTRTVCGV